MVNSQSPVETSSRAEIAWRQHVAAIAVFAVVIVVCFYRAIFCGEVLAAVDLLSKELPWRAVLPNDAPIDNFANSDTIAVFYPWKQFIHDELRAGRFPLWCMHVGCGYPLAGQGCIKLFGLTTAFLAIATPRVASVLTFSTQIFIAMTGAYALVYALRRRWAAAVFGALVYGLNSATFQQLEFEHIIGGLMMLPWLCWALWRAAEADRGAMRWLGSSGVFFGLTIINGSVQSAAIVWLSASCFAVAAAWRWQRRRFWSRSLAAIAMFSLLGAAVGAIALLPNLELFDHNARARFNQIDWWSLTLKRPVALVPWMASLANPDVVGNYRTFDLLRGLGQVGTAATTPSMSDLRTYTGLAALVLALLGLRGRSDVRFLALALILVPVVVAALTPLYLILYFRGLAAVTLGIAMLAGLGITRLLDGDSQLSGDVRRVVIGLTIAVAVVVAVGAVVTMKRSALTEVVARIGSQGTSFYKYDVAWQQQKAAETVEIFTLAGVVVKRFSLVAIITVVILVAVRRPVLAVGALTFLNTADLTEFGRRSLSSVPQSFEYPRTPALEFLQKQPGKFRVVSDWDRQTTPPTARANMLMLYGLDDPRVYESLFPANPLLSARDWDGLNVKYLVVSPASSPPGGDWRSVFRAEVDVYENLRVLPRVYFVNDINATAPQPSDIEVVSYVSGAIRLRVNAPHHGWLVVSELNYPGWRSSSGPIHLARGQWLAVEVPEGRSEVSLEYKPASVVAGGMITCAGLLGCAALVSLGAAREGKKQIGP
ncbi:MAG: hypothetical protein ACREUQ_02720 [Burkholderiales bacterium]